MHGPITNPGAPRPHRPHPPKIAFFNNYFISTPIHFKLILNLSYDNTVNLNYAWPHYQPWGPAHIDHTHPKLPFSFTIISSFLHQFTSNWYWTSLMTIRSISTMHGPITNPGAHLGQTFVGLCRAISSCQMYSSLCCGIYITQRIFNTVVLFFVSSSLGFESW